jgi:hypothetical protein
MQTAPATSQKTPKVANDDFLSVYETPLSSESGTKTTGNTATSRNTNPSAPSRALPDTRPVVAN